MGSRRLVAVLVLMLVAVVGTACGGDEDEDAAGTETQAADEQGQETFRVGITWAELQSGYFVGIKNFAEEHAATMDGIELIQTDAANDVTRQLDNVNQLLAQNIDFLVISPVSSEGMMPAIEAANQADVPVITFDRPVPGSEDLIVTHVGASAEEVGYRDGRLICEELGPEARILLASGIAGDEGANLRREGLERAMKDEDCATMTIVDQQFTEYSAERTPRIVSDWLETYGSGEVDVIMAEGDELSPIVLEVVKSANRDDIVVVGAGNFGEFPVAVCEEDPQAVGTVDFNLQKQGQDIIETAQAVRDATADELPDFVVTETVAVTSENCQDYPPIG